MVDLSKHLAKAKQSIDRRGYDIALKICQDCQEVDPANLEVYRLLLQAAKRKSQETSKRGMSLSLGLGGLSKDPFKNLSTRVKALSKTYDAKTVAMAADAAAALVEKGGKAFRDVAILFYEEARSFGLFNVDVNWKLGHLYVDRFKEDRREETIKAAIDLMAEVYRNKPDHLEAGKVLKNWEAMRSMAHREEKGTAGDYRSQLASDRDARRGEALNRIIRTKEDAEEVIGILREMVEERPDDKQLWMKLGETHRRMRQWDEATTAYERAQKVDPHDFLITVRLGDVAIAREQEQVRQAKASGQDTSAAERALLDRQIEEYARRAERQPTEMGHHFNLGQALFARGDVDKAAASFQKTVNDAKYKQQSHKFLGVCFAKKNLLDLAVNQYNECLSLVTDGHSQEAKEVRYARARLFEELGQKEQAMQDYTFLVQIDLSFKDCADRLNALRSS